MAYVEVEPGVRIFVQEWGEGSPVVLVHGGGVTHEFWDHQVAALMDRFRVVTFDLRGCGRSDCPPRGYSVDVWSEDLRALVERLGLERPAVVGHAVGSHVALRFATTCPDMLSKLVLAAPAPWFVGERGSVGGFSDQMWKGLQRGLLTNRPQAELDLADAKYFHKDPGEGMRLWTMHMALQWSLGVYVQVFESLPTVDHRDALPSLELPVLVMHGRHDTKNRYEGGIYLAEHLPDARLVTFEESAHCPPLEEVELFNEALVDFLHAPPAEGAAMASRGSGATA